MVIFGTPVVPEVGPSSATSSAAVSTLAKLVGWPAHRRIRSSASPLP